MLVEYLLHICEYLLGKALGYIENCWQWPAENKEKYFYDILHDEVWLKLFDFLFILKCKMLKI